jgi:hypothetical protein
MATRALAKSCPPLDNVGDPRRGVRSPGDGTSGDLARAHGSLTMKEKELVSIKTHLIRAAAVGTVGVATMAGFMAPASAGTASVHVRGALATARVAAKPNSNIVGSGAKVNYSPKTLSAKWSGPTKKTCTAKIISFTISNTTKTAEQVTANGKALGPKIPPGKALGICVFGKGTATGKLGLKANKKAVLTVHIS